MKIIIAAFGFAELSFSSHNYSLQSESVCLFLIISDFFNVNYTTNE